MRTANRRWFWILVLLLAAIRTASARETAAMTPSLELEIVFEDSTMPKKTEAEAMREVNQIWARYGVSVRASRRSEAVAHSAIRLPVRFNDRRAQAWASEALGSITFVGQTPEPAIEMYPNAIAALVSTIEFMGRRPEAWPVAFRDLVLGRVFGRALAHEIGHFLLRTTHHSRSGLMRAQQPAHDLAGSDRRTFVLSAAEETRLASSARSYVRSSPASVSLFRAADQQIECDSEDGL